MDRVGNGCKLCVLGDLNRGIGDRVRAAKSGGFGVPGENDNERELLEFCSEIGKVWVKHTFSQEFA